MRSSKMRPEKKDGTRQGLLRAIALFSGTRLGFIIWGSGWTRLRARVGKLREHYERIGEA